MGSGLLTEEEVRSYLELEDSELERMIKRGKLTAYRLGGTFIRFRKEEVMALKEGRKFFMPDQFERTWFDRIRDFWKFYGFYLMLLTAVVLSVYFFLKA